MNARTDLPLGLLHGMPAEQYHATPAMSAGGLKHMARSPAHFYGAMLDPARPISEPTAAMRNGTLVHCAVFEPEALAERYVVKPAGMDGRTKEGKAWAASVPSDMIIVDAAQMAAAQAQAAAVCALPEIGEMLTIGDAESSAFWIDEDTGMLCKCRPDHTAPAGDGVILIDGKTTTDASPAGFARAVATYRYHGQAAWYSDGYERATGKRVLGVVFAVVENTWPHCAAAYMLDDAALELARAENRRLLNLYAECMRTGMWPGYAAGVGVLSLPAWAISASQQPQE